MSKTRLMTAATTGRRRPAAHRMRQRQLPGSRSRSATRRSRRATSTASPVELLHRAGRPVRGGARLPMGFVRQGVVQLLTLRSQAIADRRRLRRRAGRDLPQRRRPAPGAPRATMPEEVQDDYVELASTNACASDIVDQVGRDRAGGRRASRTRPPSRSPRPASTSSTSGPTPTASRSTRATASSSVDGVLSPVDTNTSVAVGDTGQGGHVDRARRRPTPSTLPVNHRCG